MFNTGSQLHPQIEGVREGRGKEAEERVIKEGGKQRVRKKGEEIVRKEGGAQTYAELGTGRANQ